MNAVKKPLTLIILLFLLSSFVHQSQIVETTIQGKIINDNNNKAVKTKIVIYRNGQSWFTESTEDGSFSISLPNDKAYAIKIYDDNYKNHVSAVYLDANTANLSHTITLKPKQ